MRLFARLRRIGATVLIVGAVVALLVVVLPLAPALREEEPVAVPSPVCIDDPTGLPEEGVAGWRGEQLVNAATIARTAASLGFGRDAQILGVMTAMGESGLRNIDHGDWETSGVTNPDGTRTSSIGLFQQQDWWGSVQTRMDPAAAATLFYERLGRVADWQTMERSHAIHRVQVNTDREHYAKFESDAIAVIDAFSGPCPA